MYEINDFMSNIIPILFPIFFIIIFGIIIITIIKNLITWNKNNQSPRLSVISKVVSKRSDVNGHGINNGTGVHSSTNTRYYVTFEVESGDRMEFSVSGSEYGMLSEGDIGFLNFQGTRYLNFERKMD